MSSSTNVMKVSPQTIPGSLHQQNQAAFDWLVSILCSDLGLIHAHITYCRGWQGLVAYATHSTVVVVDPRTIQTIQTLSAHKNNVIKVGTICGWSHMSKSTVACICFKLYFVSSIVPQLRWSTECHHHTLTSPYSLRLASVDSGSHCVVWDVNQGAPSAEFSLGTKPLVDLQWLHTNVSACKRWDKLLSVALIASRVD